MSKSIEGEKYVGGKPQREKATGCKPLAQDPPKFTPELAFETACLWRCTA